MDNTYFEHKHLLKYNWVARDQDGGEVKRMIDLVLVKKDMPRYVQDVRAVREMGRSLSYHHIVVYSQVGRCMDYEERGSEWY